MDDPKQIPELKHAYRTQYSILVTSLKFTTGDCFCWYFLLFIYFFDTTASQNMIAGLWFYLSGHDSDNYDRGHFICSNV